MIKAIFIDIDNTLLDFDAYVREAMTEGFKAFGLPPYEEWMLGVFLRINGEFWRGIEDGTLTRAQLRENRWNAIFAALGIDFDGPTFETYFRARLRDSAIPVEGAAEMLDYLQGRYVLCAASNGPWEQQTNRLKTAGMAGYFRHVFVSERLGAEKPAAAFFDRCMAELNAGRAEPILPGEVLMLGDSLSSDMAGSIAFGMQSCLFDRSGAVTDCGLPVDHIICRLTDVRDFL